MCEAEGKQEKNMVSVKPWSSRKWAVMTCKDKVNPGKRTTNTHTHTVLYESRNLGLFELLGPITTKVF